MYRVIHNDFPVRTKGLQLLDSLSKAASDSGRHNCQCSLFHTCSSYDLFWCCIYLNDLKIYAVRYIAPDTV